MTEPINALKEKYKYELQEIYLLLSQVETSENLNLYGLDMNKENKSLIEEVKTKLEGLLEKADNNAPSFAELE